VVFANGCEYGSRSKMHGDAPWFGSGVRDRLVGVGRRMMFKNRLLWVCLSVDKRQINGSLQYAVG
jgi:hypothetical protein